MKKTQPVVLDRELDRHPAYLAWRLAVEDVRPPTSIEILSERRESAVYRLHGAGRVAGSLVAKRRPKEELADEVRLYSDLLPALPSVISLQLYGFVEEHDDGFGWFFLEDAGETWYSRDRPEHQALAVEWLAHLHVGASPGPSWLPDAGPAYFRSVLDHARDGVRAGVAHAALSASDREVLNGILTSLETVESGWQRVEEACACMPRTLVHGDFVPKNVRVRERRGRLDLVAFDWEMAGVALPAVDIALLQGTEEDRCRYLSIVNEVWPELRLPDVEQMALIGDLFFLLHGIYWDGRRFAYEWVDRAMWHMIEYERRLRMALRADGWTSA